MIILLTGASSGIGRKLALHYLNQGHTVAAVARRSEKLTELYQAPESHNGTLQIYSADVTDRGRMANVVETVERDLGPLDLVIASAGIAHQQLTHNLDLDAFTSLLQTNVQGVFHTLVPAIDAMLPRGQGQVVAISSLAAFHAIPRMGSYCATKAALTYQLEGLHWHLKPQGITVTTLCPGFINTEMTTQQQVPGIWCMAADRAVEKIAGAIAQKRRRYCFPFWQHVLIQLLNVLPITLRGFVFSVVLEKLFPRPSTPAF